MVEILTHYRNDSPANLIAKKGIFWGMLWNTDEYEELVNMVQKS